MPLNRLTDRKIYENGDEVTVTLGEVDYRGYVRGIGMQGIIDLWIVEIHPEDQQKLPQQYPYPCVVVPHPLVAPIDS